MFQHPTVGSRPNSSTAAEPDSDPCPAAEVAQMEHQRSAAVRRLRSYTRDHPFLEKRTLEDPTDQGQTRMAKLLKLQLASAHKVSIWVGCVLCFPKIRGVDIDLFIPVAHGGIVHMHLVRKVFQELARAHLNLDYD